MVTFVKTGNSVEMTLSSGEVYYLSPDTTLYTRPNEGKIYIVNNISNQAWFKFLPTDINGRSSDDLEDVALWLRDTYFVGVTLQATGTVDLGDVTIINGTGANAVNIRDGGNSITVDAPVGTPINVQIGDGSETVDVVPLAGSDALAVAIVDGSGNQITSFGGGTQYTEGDTDASITGTVMMWEDTSDTLRAVSSSKPLPVNIVAGAASGTQYTESDVDASITGTALMMESAGNTIVPAQGNTTDGLLVNLGANNDVVVSGIPELIVTNAISSTAYSLNGVAYSQTSNISNDYILDHIQFNFSTTQSRDITITLFDGTVLWAITGDTSLNIVLEDIDKAFNGGDDFTIAVTSTSGACSMDVLAVIKQGSATLAGDTNVTINAIDDAGNTVPVSATPEGHIEVAIHDPILPFGAVHVENLTPIFQFDGVYGLNSGLNFGTTSGTGTATTSDGMLTVTTGTTSLSQGIIQGRKRLRYRAGQGVVARFTSLFTTPVTYSYQLVGVGHAESGVYIGYGNTNDLTDTRFGILHVTGGHREIKTLTVTGGASSSGDITVTLNSIPFTVAVTNSSNIQRTCYEISQGSYTGWDAYPSGATVIFIRKSAGTTAGTQSFSAGTTGATATITQTRAGAASTDTFYAQENWNGDKLDGTGASGITLDKTKLNIWQIGIGYLGTDALVVKCKITPPGGNNATWVVCHTIAFPNTRTTPIFSNPSFPFTLAAYSAGSTTNLTVKSGSVGGFIEGAKNLHGNRFTYFNQLTTVGATNLQALFTVLNARVYTEKASQVVINLLNVSGAIKHTSPVIFYLIRNGVLAGNPNFQSLASNSASLWDTAATTVTYATGDQLIATFHVGDTGEFDHHFGNGQFNAEEVTLQPGEWITLAARATTGTPSYVTGSLNTREDQ